MATKTNTHSDHFNAVFGKIKWIDSSWTNNSLFTITVPRLSPLTTLNDIDNYLNKQKVPFADIQSVRQEIMEYLMNNHDVNNLKDIEEHCDIIQDDDLVGVSLEATDTDKLFFDRLKYTTENGERIWLFRKHESANEFVTIMGKRADLTSLYYANMLTKYKCYSEYKQAYIDVASNASTGRDLAIVGLKISEAIAKTGSIPKGAKVKIKYNIPTFESYLGETLTLIGSDECLYVDSMPKALSNRTDVPCFKYFNPDSLKDGNCKHWMDFIARFPSKEHRLIFMEWLYMVFVEDASCDQKMYIRGEGGDGKSSIYKSIHKYLGSDACMVAQSGSFTSSHWAHKVYNKRLVIHADSKNPKPLDNEKSHLNNDLLDVDGKYMVPFTAQANYMELYMSNDIPEIADVDNETRRMIYINLNPLTEEQRKTFCKTDENGNLIIHKGKYILLGNPDFQKEVDEQFEAFLFRCKKVYDANNGGTKSNVYIPTTVMDTMFTDIIDDASEFEYITEHMLHVSKTDMTNTYILAHDLKTLYENTRLKTEIKTYNSFTRLLKIKYPHITKGAKKENGKTYKVWYGIRFETQFQEDLIKSNEYKVEDIQNKILNSRGLKRPKSFKEVLDFNKNK